MFFKDIADFKTYFTVNASFNFNELCVYLKQVDNDILKKYLGETFFTQAQTAYNNSISANNPQPMTGDIKDAVELIRKCTPFFAIIKWIPAGQVQIDNAGIRIASNENFKTAFQWQIRELQDSLNESGTAALDDLLEFLESKISAFQGYQGSDEYKSNKELFVSSSAVFQKYYSLMYGGRSNYYRLKSIIRKCEDFDLKAILLPDLFNNLKTKLKAGTLLNADEKNLLEYVFPAVVNLTVARAVNEMPARLNANGFLVFDNTGGRETIDSKKSASHNDLNRLGEAADRDGKTYLSLLKSFLEANKTIYTLYANDAMYTSSNNGIVAQDETDSFFHAL